MPKSPASEVAAYYEGNTRRFVRWGEGGGVGALHAGLWAPGVQTVEEAADKINLLCAEALRPALPSSGVGHVVDMGCGVGGTAVRLAELLDARVTGLTLSALQVDLAAERARAHGASGRCTFHCADFLHPPALAPTHGVVAIEAFAHAADPARFFEVAADLLVPGGRLVVVDDFLNPATEGQRKREATVARFRRGWRLHSVISAARADELARRSGFSLDDDRDLTPWVRLGRPRDRAIAAAVALLGWLRPLERVPAWATLTGGDALQTCLRRRWIDYRLLTWTRR